MRHAGSLGLVIATGLASVALAQPAQFLEVGDAVFVARPDFGLPFRYHALDVPDQVVGPYFGVQATLMGGLGAQTLLDPMPPGSATILHLYPTAGNAEFVLSALRLLADGSVTPIAQDFIPFQQEPEGGYDVTAFPGVPPGFPQFAWTEGSLGAVGVFDGAGFSEIGDSPLLSAPRGMDRVRGPMRGKLGIAHDFTVVVVDTRLESVVLIDLLTTQISVLSSGGLIREPTAVAVGPYGIYVGCPSQGPGQPARIVEVNHLGQQTLIYSGTPFVFPTDIAYYDGGYAVGSPLRLLVSDRLGPNGFGGIMLLDLGAKTATADVISSGNADGYAEPEGVSAVPPGSDCPGSDCPGSDCPGDTTGDSSMDINDFFQFLDYYQTGDDRADLTLDGNINTNDFFEFLEDYKPGSDCP